METKNQPKIMEKKIFLTKIFYFHPNQNKFSDQQKHEYNAEDIELGRGGGTKVQSVDGGGGHMSHTHSFGQSFN